MHEIVYSKEFKNSFIKIKDKTIRKQIKNKISELGIRAPIGKKLINQDGWRIRVNQYRVIYRIQNNKIIIILTILNRKNNYK